MRPGRGYAGVASSLEWRSEQRHPGAAAPLRRAGRDVGNGTGRREAAGRGVAVWVIRLRRLVARVDVADKTGNDTLPEDAVRDDCS